MSDFLVSEILVLVLLVPPLLRPFSKSLQTAAAVPVLPLCSAAVAALTIWGHGITVSFLPIPALIIICIITEFLRFAMFLGGLPNDFYSFPSILLRLFLSVLLLGAFFSAFYFSPEQEYKPVYSDISKEPLVLTKNGKEIRAGFCYEPKESKEKKGVRVLVLSPFSGSSGEPSTVSLYLADKGFTVIEPALSGGADKGFPVKRSEVFFAVLQTLLKKEPEQILERAFDQALSVPAEKERPLYVFAEGLYTRLLAEYTAKNPAAFEGVFYVISEDEKLPRSLSAENAYILDERKELRFSKSLSEYPACVLIRKKESLSGWGELRCEDVLAARLLGAERDLGRKDRLFTAATAEKWLELK